MIVVTSPGPSEGKSLTALGAVYLALGNYPSAFESYREAHELLEEHGAEDDVGFPLLGLGKVLNRLGDYTSASQPLKIALALREGKDEVTGEAVVKSPMPGLIISVPVQEGQEVEKGDRIVILESMKMENELHSPRSGIVKHVYVVEGDSVEKGQLLATIGDPS